MIQPVCFVVIIIIVIEAFFGFNYQLDFKAIFVIP